MDLGVDLMDLGMDLVDLGVDLVDLVDLGLILSGKVSSGKVCPSTRRMQKQIYIYMYIYIYNVIIQ